ncbi:MAG: ComF family protein [Tannerella sp.]|jgi:ComF family protein|nr:ComF family protein [Tannerella sp.]
MSNILNDLLNLLYPDLCILCRKPLIDDEKYLCLDCLCNMPNTNFHTNRGNPARALFAGYPQLKEVTSYLFFEKEGPAQKLVHSFKYYGNRRLAEYLGKIAAIELKEYGFYASIDLIIPIPLHRKKERKRGYNQSDFIARGFSAVYGCEVSKGLVERIVHTKTQTRKSIYDRHVNVEEIFRLTDTESLYGKHVLIIDDVITTGATISACIDALAKAPEIKISIFSLSIAGGT